MPNEVLQRAVSQLNGFFNVSTKDDLVLELLKPTPPEVGPPVATPNDTDLGQIASTLASVADGGLDTKGVIKRLEEFTTKDSSAIDLIDSKVMIFASKPDAKLKFVKDIKDVIGDKLSSDGRLSAIVMKSIQLLPAGRDVNATTLFMNAIPTLEFSRAVPYLNIEIQLSRPVFEPNTKRLQMMSLARFLEGSLDVKDGTADSNLIAAQGIKEKSGDEESLRSIAGMELFTSPQTLVNPDPRLNANRAAAVIDPFRPFMSVERFNVELVPHLGFFAYRAADLELILHDRSRMADIADFIQPDLYANSEMLIEWGWSHPGDNVFGVLLNAMRAREKFRVVNSSFSMTQVGEVKIKLKIASKGASDMWTVQIGGGGDVAGAGNVVRELQKQISELRVRIKAQQVGKSLKEIRGVQNMLSTAEDLSTSITLTKKQRKQLQGLIRSKGASDELPELRKILEDLFVGTKQEQPKAAAFAKSLATAIDERLDLIVGKKTDRTSDPFIDLADETKWKNNEKKSHVSFAKLMMLFVGVPLSAKTDSYDDVQLLFYPFNHRAGKVRNKNVAEFMIDVQEFRKAMVIIAQARRGNNIPLREFIQFISNNFIDDQGSENYGLKGVYSTKIDPTTGTRVLKESKKNDKVIAAELEARLIEMGITDGIFKMPMLDVMIESVPGTATENGEAPGAARAKTILRLHFFDKTATRYESLGDLMRASRVNNVGTLGERKTENIDPAEHVKLYNTFINEMKRRNIIKLKEVKEGSKGVYELVGTVQQIKDFITENVPTLVYGSNNTAIKEASFTTMQEPLLTTVNMIRAGKQGTVSPEGLSPGNLPLQTLPAMASITSFGCPLVGYMQQFFFDFGTNTTMDNIYGVNKLKHELSQGKFESKWELVPLDAYGEYRSVVQTAGAMITELDDLAKAPKQQ